KYSDDDEVLLPGGSGIIGPDSHWIAGPVSDKETIVYGDVDLSLIAQEQQAFDVAGHYNRSDIFSLTVDDRPRNQVTWLRGSEVTKTQHIQKFSEVNSVSLCEAENYHEKSNNNP